MQSTEQLARADEARRDYLDNICRPQIQRKKARGWGGPNKGKALAMLPTNWQEIKDAVFKHIKPEHLREYLGTMVSCVGDRFEISHTAMAREKKVSAQTILNYVRRQDRDSWPWLRAEVDRIADKRPRPVYAERKAG